MAHSVTIPSKLNEIDAYANKIKTIINHSKTHIHTIWCCGTLDQMSGTTFTGKDESLIALSRGVLGEIKSLLDSRKTNEFKWIFQVENIQSDVVQRVKFLFAEAVPDLTVVVPLTMLIEKTYFANFCFVRKPVSMEQPQPMEDADMKEIRQKLSRM